MRSASNPAGKRFARGLQHGVDFVQNTLKVNVKETVPVNNQPAQAPVQKKPAEAEAAQQGGGFNWGGILCIGIVVILGIWLLFGLIRSFTGGGGGGGGMAGGGGMGGGYGGGGGGFLSGLMGGLFGAVAGNWMYDRFFHDHSSYGGGMEPRAYGNEGQAADGPRDVSSSGGDFDDADAGGGDAGGGDFDAGDSGGGDFDGGGGGDFGGGGDTGGGDIGGGGDTSGGSF